MFVMGLTFPYNLIIVGTVNNLVIRKCKRKNNSKNPKNVRFGIHVNNMSFNIALQYYTLYWGRQFIENNNNIV